LNGFGCFEISAFWVLECDDLGCAHPTEGQMSQGIDNYVPTYPVDDGGCGLEK